MKVIDFDLFVLSLRFGVLASKTYATTTLNASPGRIIETAGI